MQSDALQKWTSTTLTRDRRKQLTGSWGQHDIVSHSVLSSYPSIAAPALTNTLCTTLRNFFSPQTLTSHWLSSLQPVGNFTLLYFSSMTEIYTNLTEYRVRAFFNIWEQRILHNFALPFYACKDVNISREFTWVSIYMNLKYLHMLIFKICLLELFTLFSKTGSARFATACLEAHSLSILYFVCLKILGNCIVKPEFCPKHSNILSRCFVKNVLKILNYIIAFTYYA